MKQSKQFIARLFISFAGTAFACALALAPAASAATTYTSGITVQPVFVQRCPSNQACPLIDQSFYGTYTVSAVQGNSTVSTATTTGPGYYTLGVPAGTYTLDFSSKGYATEPLTSTVTVADGQVVGPYQLHFIYHR